MTELSLFCLNLKSSGGWKIETNKHQQIIALTTQLNEMETKLASSLKKLVVLFFLRQLLILRLILRILKATSLYGVLRKH